MAQHDYSIANQGFPATRADLNNALSAIATNNSGTSAPSTQYAGQFWIDTTSSTWTLYIHDGADDIQFATIDTSANTVNFIDSELGDNSVTTAKIADGNVTSAKLSYPLTTFSSTGIDDNATSTAITIDSNENVGIGTASPNNYTNYKSLTLNGTTGGLIDFESNGTLMGEIYCDATKFLIDSEGAIPLVFRTNSASERMRIDSSGNVGIGTSSPSVKLEVSDDIAIRGGSDRRITLGSNGTIDANDSNHIRAESTVLKFNSAGGEYIFEQNGTEAMRISSAGDVLVGKTSTSVSTAGAEMRAIGYGVFVVDSSQPILVNRLTNDGVLLSLRQNTVEEGTISVSGSTVSYNGFTGTHWSRFIDNSTPNILRGTVLESLDEMCDWYNLHFETTTTIQDEDGNDVTKTENHVVSYVLQNGQSDGDVITYNHEGTDVQATIVKETDIKHVKSKISDTVDAKNVYGVFIDYDNDGEGYNDFYVASVGSFVVRIKQGETVAKGDLLQSNGDGTAKVQSDDAIRASTFAKVLSTTVIETYEDGSYLVPCSLMC